MPGADEAAPSTAHHLASNFTGPQNWTEEIDYGASTGAAGSGGIAILGNSCVPNGTTLYCVGGQNSQNGTDLSDAFYTSVSASGTQGSWIETTDYGATSGTSGHGGYGVEFPACVTNGGYIYCVAGALSNPPFVWSRVYFAAISASGIGAWTETTDYGAASGTNGTTGVSAFGLSCAVSGSDIYCVGGSSKVFYAALSASGVGPWTETTDYAAASGNSGSGGRSISDTSCAVNNTDLYCVAGNINFTATSRVFYAPVGATGVGAWQESTDYGAASGSSGSGGVAIYGQACASDSGYLMCVAGSNASASTAGVYYAPVTTSGVGAWVATPNYGDAPLSTYRLYCAVLHALGFLACGGGFTSKTFTTPLHPVPVTKTHPTITTSLSADGLHPGASFSDTAVLSGATPNAGGHVTYFFFANSGCTATLPLYPNFNVTVTNGAVPPSGTWPVVWSSSGYNSVQAFYWGDANNSLAYSSCELIQVAPWAPSLTTTLSAASVAAGGTFTDAASLQNGAPNAHGTVDYHQYGDDSCTNSTGGPEGGLVTGSSVQSSGPFTAVASKSGYNSVQAVYGGDGNDTPARGPCETIKVTPAVGTTPPSNGSSSKPNTFLGLPTYEGYAVILGIVAGVVALLIALLAFRRRGGVDGPGQPPNLPPRSTPVAPPVIATTEEEMCIMKADVDDSEPDVRVNVSEAADSSYQGKGEQIERALIEKIKEHKVYSSADWGVAIAESDGAAVGGSVAAGSILSTFGGSETERIAASDEGHSEIQLFIRAPDGARTMISGAVLTAAQSNAQVLDVPEDLWEGLEIESWIVTGTESVMRLVGSEEWIEKIEHVIEAFNEHLTAKQKAELLKELRIWQKAFVRALKDPKSAAKNVKILYRNLARIIRTYGTKVIKIWELTKFLSVEFAAVAIEKVGAWAFENADVQVMAKGAMDYRISPCTAENSRLEVASNDRLLVESGDLKEPADKKFERSETRQASGSCTSTHEMTIHVDGEVSVSGSAQYAGDGYANLNSLWAANWVMACEHGKPGDDGYRKEQEQGSKWGGWFKVPDSARANFPSDTTAADTADMRNYVVTLLNEKLEELMTETFEETKNSPLDDSKNTEEKLKGVLDEWYKFVQEKLGLFEKPEAE